MMRYLALFVTLVFAGCANLPLDNVYRNPSFQYETTHIDSVSFSSLHAISTIRISNKNPYSLPISRLNAELWLEGKPWLALDNDSITGIPALGNVSVDFNWSLIFDQLLSNAANTYRAGEADFTLKISPTFTVPVIGEKTIDWSSSFTVPVPKLPKLSLVDWRVESLNLSSVKLALDVDVFNPNVFAITTKLLQLNINKGDESIAQLGLNDSVIKSAGHSTQTVEFNLSTLNAGLVVVNAFKTGKWPSTLSLDWAGEWNSPDLDFELPDLRGAL